MDELTMKLIIGVVAVIGLFFGGKFFSKIISNKNIQKNITIKGNDNNVSNSNNPEKE